jgi:glycosyltransferase involved in cell wall biosynthesis
VGKVIAFVHGYNPLHGMGGGASYFRTHARAAARLGYEPHLFYAARVATLVKTEYGIVHEARRSRLNPLPKDGDLEIAARKCVLGWQAPRVAAAMARFLAALPGPHVIHGISAWGYTALLAAEMLRQQGIAASVVSSVYTTAEHESGMKARRAALVGAPLARLATRLEHAAHRRFVVPLEGRLFAESRIVTLNYEAVHRLFLKAHGPGTEVRKLPYAAESAFLHPAAEPPGPLPAPLATLTPRAAPLIMSVSRHDPRKGLDVFIRALARLRDRGVSVRACLISGGFLLGEHRRLAERLGLADIVAFPGWVSDPYEYLRHADVFVLPSFQEASGALSLLEALQAGVSIVASNIDGIPEDVTDGDSALLVPPGDVAALSDALERLVADRILRERLARRARETFEARFSVEAFTRALGDLYADMGIGIGPGYDGLSTAGAAGDA